MFSQSISKALSSLAGSSFLSCSDITTDQIQAIFQLALQFKKGDRRKTIGVIHIHNLLNILNWSINEKNYSDKLDKFYLKEEKAIPNQNHFENSIFHFFYTYLLEDIYETFLVEGLK